MHTDKKKHNPCVSVFLRGLIFSAAVAFAAEAPQVTFDRAAQALTHGNYPEAEQGFQAVLRVQPQNVGALANLATVYSRTGRAGKAIATYQRALKLSPKDSAILLNLGIAYLRQEAHQRALPLFDRVVALDPKNDQARQLRAVCRLYTGQLTEAIQDLEAFRKTHEPDPQVLFLLGFAYLKTNDPDRAKPVFEQMFSIIPPAQGQLLLGRACYEAALFDRAEESYLAARKLQPDLPGLHLELGKLYISQRRTDGAVRELTEVIRQNPSDGEANYFLGALLIQGGKAAEGLPYLNRALEQKPDTWSTLFYLGKAKLRLGQHDAAISLLERAAQLNPDESSIYYQLGRALQAGGRTAEAREAFQKVQQLKAGALGEERIPGIR